MKRALLLLTLAAAGCTSNPYAGSPSTTNDTSRYTLANDTGPAHGPEHVAHLQEPVVIDEPKSRYGNPSSYEEFGVTYHVLDDASGYDARGEASWYGKKFHGHRTSSGETYDMYKLSAAHKTLPLPTWVRVTNLENGASTVVRVNDRGPFHGNRLIDLSWAAAVKLGIDKAGTGHVRVQALSADSTTVAGNTSPAPAPVAAAVSSPPPAAGLFLQVGAFQARASAEQLATRVMLESGLPVSLRNEEALHRVWVGPFTSESDRLAARQQLIQRGLPAPVNAGTTP
ncbi:MAG: septal ring lytic transglycosylase RlpA family protein [Alcanivoracaceae bacterium]